jgi:hypothetical protein
VYAVFFPVERFMEGRSAMLKRLMCCVAGAALGAYLGSTINESLGLSMEDALAVCSLGGMVLGYVAFTLLEVFTAKSDPLFIRPDAD